MPSYKTPSPSLKERTRLITEMVEKKNESQHCATSLSSSQSTAEEQQQQNLIELKNMQRKQRGLKLLKVGKQLKENNVEAVEKTPAALSPNKNIPIFVPLQVERQYLNKMSQTNANAMSPPSLAELSGEKPLKTNLYENLVLAHHHPELQVQVLATFNESPLLSNVIMQMEKLCLTKLYRTQAYSWPHLVKHKSLFVVGAPKSGKTLCYLPPIASMVASTIKSDFPHGVGPIAVVMVKSVRDVESVNACFRELIGDIGHKVRTLPSHGVRLLTETALQLYNGCSVLIATPANLLRLLNNKETAKLFNMQRLEHLVFDDLDQMLLRAEPEVEAVLLNFRKLAEKAKTSFDKLHIVATSTYWHPALVKLLRLSYEPMLVFGDFIEAAVYGKTKITINFCEGEHKIEATRLFLAAHPPNRERTVIFCKDDASILALYSALRALNIKCISYNSTASFAKRGAIVNWKNEVFQQLIICMDDNFPELELRNAHNIIHFDMSSNWTKFTKRFGALLNNLENFVATNFEQYERDGQHANSTHALLLLDEQINMELPMLVTFMQRNKQFGQLPTELLQLSEAIKTSYNQQCIKRRVPLCEQFIEFGDCDAIGCELRHAFTKHDAQLEEGMPDAGHLEMLVLRVVSPTHYIVRLLFHKPLDDDIWQPVRGSNLYATEATRLGLHFLRKENLDWHWPLHVNDLCVINYDGAFSRARILSAPHIEDANILQVVKVSVFLIDTGELVQKIKSDNLYSCPEQFRDLPPQAVHVRLLGAVPVDNDRTWDSKATNKINNELQACRSREDCAVQAPISFVFADTIWVGNLLVMQRLKSCQHYVYKYNLKRDLVSNKFADKDTQLRQNLLKTAMELGMVCRNATELPNAGLQENCDEEEESVGARQRLSSGTEECMSEPEEEENWDAESAEEPQANEISLPLQEAVTAAKSQWSELTLGQSVLVEIGREQQQPESATGTYLRLMDAESQQKEQQLAQLISEYMQNEEKPNKMVELVEGEYFLLKHKGIYKRALLVLIWEDEEEQMRYCFFVCDYAHFVTLSLDDFLDASIICATTDEIQQFTPFQSVHCRLAGVQQLTSLLEFYTPTKLFLHACAVQQTELQSATISKVMAIKAYYVLLYETDEEQPEFQPTKSKMINHKLLNSKLLKEDVATKHLLEENVSKDMDAYDILDFFERSVQLEMTEYGSDDEDKRKVAQQDLEIVKALRAAKNKNLPTLPYIKEVSEAVPEPRPMSPLIPIKQMPLLKKAPNLAPFLNSNNLFERAFNTRIRVGKETLMAAPAPEEVKAKPISNQAYGELKPAPEEVKAKPISNQSYGELKPLVAPNIKRPMTRWSQNKYQILLIIQAPDVERYQLRVSSKLVCFKAIVDGVQNMLLLNLYGAVQPEYVSHEKRGLNVIVRLKKSIFLIWKQLVEQPDKFPWLTYDMSLIPEMSNRKPLPTPDTTYSKCVFDPDYIVGNEDSSSDSDEK